jgi:hypothetical protein
MIGSDPFTVVLADLPAVATALDDVRASAWQATDPALLELCRLRMARLLRCDAELVARTPEAIAAGFDERKAEQLHDWPHAEVFDDRDRAALAFTEQYVIDVAALDNPTVEGLRAHLGDDGLTTFVGALLAVEQRLRLAAIWRTLRLAPDPETDATTRTDPAVRTGAAILHTDTTPKEQL